MIDVRPFVGLGRFDTDWLTARYHFSFADYFDPRRMGLGPLKVWNDDTFHAGGGFPMHGHRDMEIITYVRSGAISHRDHLGNAGRTEAGDVQIMSAGTGIRHSEYNYESEDTLIFQIWVVPSAAGIAPRWATRRFPGKARAGRLIALASGRAGDDADALPICQDAALLAATLAAGQATTHDLVPGRRAYLVPATGAIEVNGIALGARDGAAITGERGLTIRAAEDSEMVLLDLP